MFANIGFLVFMVIAIGIPIAVDFSLDELQKNAFILFRGVLIFLWIFFYTRNFTSSGAYARLKHLLPNQLIELIQLSTDLLPEMQKTAYAEIKKNRISRKMFFEPIVDFFYAFIKVGENLSDTLNSNAKKKVFIISGKIHEGKTTLARKLVSELHKQGKKVGGILCEAENKDDKRYSYYAEDLITHHKMKMIVKEDVTDYYDKFWSYCFLKDGMNFAFRCLSVEYLKGLDAVFIDEVGAMELEGRGFCNQVSELLNSNAFMVFLVVRDQFIDNICRKFNIKPSAIIRVGDSDINFATFLLE